MSIKDIAAESGLTIIDEAPVQAIKSDDLAAAIKRLRFIVPNGQKMADESLAIIASESILHRTMPGRDIHYYEDWNGLKRIFDYKYLKNFAVFKEQLLSGDTNAAIEDRDRPLTEAERVQHSIQDHEVAALCTITTPRERREFFEEVRRWKDQGFTPKEALALARETYGELGTTAVGIVDPTEKDKKGNPITPPRGWSYYQWAAKLAFKNAVNRKYGIPTADESRMMAYAQASRALPRDWGNVDPFEPVSIQARLAEMEGIARRAQENPVTPEEFAANVELLRGPADEPMGEYVNGDKIRFAGRVVDEIPFYNNGDDIDLALKNLEIKYDPENEDFIFEQLNLFANQQADDIAQ